MKNILLISFALLCMATLGFGQEPDVKIIAAPDIGNYDQVMLKNGTNLPKVRVRTMTPGDNILVVQKGVRTTYRWSEVQQIMLSKVSLLNFNANWGKQITVVCDTNALKDRLITERGEEIEGTIYEFNPYYKIKIQQSSFVNRSLMWSDLKQIILAKSSPFFAYSTDEACKTGSAPEALKEKSDFKVKDGAISASYETELSSDQIRKSWALRGGALFSKEMNFNLSMMTSKTGGMDMKGYGYGMSGALNLVNLSPPIYPDKPSCLITRLGANFGMNLFFLNIDLPETPGATTEITTAMQSTVVMGLNFGFQQAMGKFLSSKSWKGIAVGVAWRPTYQYSSFTMQTKTTVVIQGTKHYYYANMDDSESTLNMKGFEVYFDFLDLNSITTRFAKPAHFKLNFFFLPPMGDMKMTFIQVGIGMITY